MKRLRTPLGASLLLLTLAVGPLQATNREEKTLALATDTVRTLAVGKMRGESSERNGVTIINDCYNANPEAMRSMLEVLRGTPARRRIAVLGEMLELGREAGALHRDIGQFAAEQGIDALLGVRGAARFMVEGAVEAGMSDSAASFFESPEEAGNFLRNYVRPGDAVLFKGSRGVQMEKALERAFEMQEGTKA